MRILFIGDIVGRSGRAVLRERLGALVQDWKLDFVAINGENAAGGFGITEAIYQEFVDAGVDVITGGNHSWEQMADAIIIDIHGEATSEKQAIGHFCDGRASLVVGTHTHVPTADHQILPRGTAFISDVGMTGDYDSVIGMDKDEPLTRFLTKISGARFEPAMGEATLCALAVETDDANGLARRIAAVRLGGRLQEARPQFWEHE